MNYSLSNTKLIKIDQRPTFEAVNAKDFDKLWIPAFATEEGHICYSYFCEFRIYPFLSPGVSAKAETTIGLSQSGVLRRVVNQNGDGVIVFTIDDEIDLELSQMILKQCSLEYLRDLLEYEFEKMSYCGMEDMVPNSLLQNFLEIENRFSMRLKLRNKDLVQYFNVLPECFSQYVLEIVPENKYEPKLLEKIRQRPLDWFRLKIDPTYFSIISFLKNETWLDISVLKKMPLIPLMMVGSIIPTKFLKIFTNFEELGRRIPECKENKRFIIGEEVMFSFLEISRKGEYKCCDNLPEETSLAFDTLMAYDFQEGKYLIHSSTILAWIYPVNFPGSTTYLLLNINEDYYFKFLKIVSKREQHYRISKSILLPQRYESKKMERYFVENDESD